MSSRHPWMRFLALGLAIAGLVIALNVMGVTWSSLEPERIRAYVLSFGWAAPVVYVLLFAQPLVPLPASIMMMAAGLAFGFAAGLPLAYGAALLRACGQFLLTRWLGREAVEGLLRGRMAQFDHTVERWGFQAVFWFRLIANVPYDVQNFSLGLSAIHFSAYLLATALSVLPTTALCVYIGHTSTGTAALWRVGGLLFALVAFGVVYRWLRAKRFRAMV